MSVVLLVLGCLLVTVAVVDAVVTTLSLFAGAGTLSGRLGGVLWRGMLARHTRRKGSGRVLRWSGLCILMATFVVWTGLLWGGWFCVFLSADNAVVVSTTGLPADAASRLYFAGYTVFTFGNGDFAPGATWAEILSALASLSGLFLVTLSITYFLQVVEAVVHKRQFAQLVHSLGQDGPRILAQGWTGKEFTPMFSQHLVALTGPLLRMGEQHLAYPVAHYFHSPVESKSPAHAVAVLDDALFLLTEGVAPPERSDPAATAPLSQAVGKVLTTLQTEFFPHPSQPTSPPSLDMLREVGVPSVSQTAYTAAARRRTERRAAVTGYLRSDGWA